MQRSRGRGFTKFMLCVNEDVVSSSGVSSVPALTVFDDMDPDVITDWSAHSHTQDPLRRMSAGGALDSYHNNALLWENHEGRMSIPSARLTSSEAETMQRIYQSGVVTGVNIPLCVGGVHAKVVVSYFSSKRLSDLKDVEDSVAILFYLAHCIYEELSPRLPLHDSSTPSLTPREREVLDWVAKGKTAMEMATIMSLSVETVRDHIKNMRGKLGARTKAEAVARARRLD